MSTIQGFQVFSPIGFENYPCKYTNLCRECESCDVSQSAGYFDRENTDIISFYSKDYVNGNINYSIFYNFYLQKNLPFFINLSFYFFYSEKINGISCSDCEI